MANSLPPSRSFFPGLALLFVGALLLVHNYRGLDISQLFHYWWPLIIIFWGAIKLYERAVASRSGGGISTISGARFCWFSACFRCWEWLPRPTSLEAGFQ